MVAVATYWQTARGKRKNRHDLHMRVFIIEFLGKQPTLFEHLEDQ